MRGARTPLPTRHTRSVNARGKSANRAWPPGTSSSGISSLSDGRSPGGGSSLWMIPRSACERPRASSPSSRRSLLCTAPWLRAEVTGWCSGALRVEPPPPHAGLARSRTARPARDVCKSDRALRLLCLAHSSSGKAGQKHRTHYLSSFISFLFYTEKIEPKRYKFNLYAICFHCKC